MIKKPFLKIIKIYQNSNCLIKKLFLEAIKIYQNFISPGLGRNCRFYPSCSRYSYLAIEKYGLAKGLRQGLKRFLRCHPWEPGGEDLP